MSGMIDGRHCELPSAMNCGAGSGKGRGCETARFLSETLCQNRKGTSSEKPLIATTNLVVSTLDVNIVLE
jgi:hypothetical protein